MAALASKGHVYITSIREETITSSRVCNDNIVTLLQTYHVELCVKWSPCFVSAFLASFHFSNHNLVSRH